MDGPHSEGEFILLSLPLYFELTLTTIAFGWLLRIYNFLNYSQVEIALLTTDKIRACYGSSSIKTWSIKEKKQNKKQIDTKCPCPPLLRRHQIKRIQRKKKKKKKMLNGDDGILTSWKLCLNVVVQRFMHSAVLADNPARRSTLSRWHGVALQDSIFNPLGTGSAKQEVDRMLRVRRQSGHFRVAHCRVGHNSFPVQIWGSETKISFGELWHFNESSW